MSNKWESILKVFEIVSLVLLFATVIAVIVTYNSLADQIPTHYNLGGKPTRFNDKIWIFTLPAVSIVCHLIVRFFKNNPKYLSHYNYRSMKKAYNAIIVIDFIAVLFFLLMTIQTIRHGLGFLGA